MTFSARLRPRQCHLISDIVSARLSRGAARKGQVLSPSTGRRGKPAAGRAAKFPTLRIGPSASRDRRHRPPRSLLRSRPLPHFAATTCHLISDILRRLLPATCHLIGDILHLLLTGPSAGITSTIHRTIRPNVPVASGHAQSCQGPSAAMLRSGQKGHSSATGGRRAGSAGVASAATYLSSSHHAVTLVNLTNHQLS